jgi:hydroxylamine reductase
MFCYQCQETGNRKGCTYEGVCGKTDETANLQDTLIYSLKGLAFYIRQVPDVKTRRETGMLAAECLFATVTNTNFDSARIVRYIRRVLANKAVIKEMVEKARLAGDSTSSPEITPNAEWDADSEAAIYQKSLRTGVLDIKDPDERSVKETIVYGMKGLSAYTYHAGILGYFDDTIFDFIFEGLYRTSIQTSMDELMDLVFKTGEITFRAMKILDLANSETYGIPSPVLVKTGTEDRPGILVSGHELKDLEMLLEQSMDKGVDIYTHGEMILAQSLPFFRKYPHLKGNYGNAWWLQADEFETFNGPVLVTSNCIIPPRKSYMDRLYTSSVAGYPGVKHIEETCGKTDFGEIIRLAGTCIPPKDLMEPDFMTGFNHQYLVSITDKIVEAVRAGKIKKFVVMAGCDGRDNARRYYSEKAVALEEGSIILTAGCAKYRYIKKIQGDIDGIPKVLDAGQCSDSYSILAFALHLMNVFHTEDINDLPVEIDMAWYDQKAIAIFLTLLQMGVKKIKIGPTLPEYILQYILGKISDRFEISTVLQDE